MNAKLTSYKVTNIFFTKIMRISEIELLCILQIFCAFPLTFAKISIVEIKHVKIEIRDTIIVFKHIQYTLK